MAAWTVSDGTSVPDFKTEAHHRDRSAQWGHKGRKCEVFLTLPLLTPHPNLSASPPRSLPACQLGTGCSSELRAPHPPIPRGTGEAGTSVPRRKACRCKAPSSQEQRSARSGFLFCFGLSHGPLLTSFAGFSGVLIAKITPTHAGRVHFPLPAHLSAPEGEVGGMLLEKCMCLSRRLGGLQLGVRLSLPSAAWLVASGRLSVHVQTL